MIELSIVIPAYNERANIGITLTKVTNFLNDYEPNYEVLVVDDGSLDNTAEIVKGFSKDNPKVILVSNPHKGKGYSVRTGILKSQGKYVLLSDADLATPIEELKRLFVWIKDNDFDIVIASREGVGANRKNEPLSRHFMGRVFNILVQVLLLPGISDTQCGFKLFKTNVGKIIFSKSLLYGDSSQELRVPKVTAFDVEILYIARKLGYKIKEVPVQWEYGTQTKVNRIRDSLYNLSDVLHVKFNSIKGLYNK